MTKLFIGVRIAVAGSVLAAAGLTGCNSCGNACAPACAPCAKNPVYRSPCCEAQMNRAGAPMGPAYVAPGGTYVAPQPAPMTPQHSGYAGPGSQMSCGAGKCG